MEQIISLIFYGCKLAKDLESNLPNIANQPNILSDSCDEIIRVFSAARDRLNANQVTTRGSGHESEVGGGVQEWLRYSSSQAMDLVLHAQILGDQTGGFGVHGLPENSRMQGSGGEVPATDVADSGRGSSAQRPRRRRDDADNHTIIVPAPRMGNTEIPPEDDYTWRKYGQKEILGSRFPRAYYRCTHQKLYQCPAKKQVQRLDNDPDTFEVLYRGHHTCTMSSTAPSTVPPPPTTDMTPQESSATHPPLPTSAPPSHWLSIRPSGEGSSTAFAGMQMYRPDITLGGSGSGGAGPSTVRLGRDVEYQPVVDLADAMFNSGSSSDNMDIIFSSPWEAGDKKN